MNPVIVAFLILTVIFVSVISTLLIDAYAEVVMKTLWSAWDEAPCYSFNISKDQLAYRYTLLKSLKDLKSDIGDKFQIWAIPKDGCVKIITHSRQEIRDDRYIYGEALCNKDAPINTCRINMYLENLPLNVAYAVMKHEAFHTFGFGHLTTSTLAEYPAAILTSDLMRSGVNQHSKFSEITLYAFKQKYGEDGFDGLNNHTRQDIIIPKELVVKVISDRT